MQNIYRRVMELAHVRASGANRQTVETCASKRSTAACFESIAVAPPAPAPTAGAAGPREVDTAAGSAAASLLAAATAEASAVEAAAGAEVALDSAAT